MTTKQFLLTIEKDLQKLEAYRDLFATIEKSNHSLEYSGEELLSYFKKIESGKWMADKDGTLRTN